MLEIEKLDPAWGAREIRLGQVGTEGQASDGKALGAIRGTDGAQVEVDQPTVKTVRTALAKTKLKTPTAKGTRAENQVKEASPERPFKRRRYSQERAKCLHRS